MRQQYCRIREAGGDSRALLETAACLYQLQARYDLTLAILLRLRKDTVFDFICSHHLMPLIKGHAVTQLISINPQRAERLLVDYHEEAPPGVVVPAIQVGTAFQIEPTRNCMKPKLNACLLNETTKLTNEQNWLSSMSC